MAFDFDMIPSGGRGPTRRRFRIRRLIPQLICLLVALAVFVGLAVVNPDVDPGNLWAIPTVPLWISVFTGHVWRRVPADFEGLGAVDATVLRRRVRRIFWRAALVLVFVAFALLWVASLWHWRASIAEDAGDYATSDADSGHYSFFAGLWWWPLPVAAFLILAQPVLSALAFARMRRPNSLL